VAERQLPKLNVAGSIPVSRSSQIACKISQVLKPREHTHRQPFPQLMKPLQALLKRRVELVVWLIDLFRNRARAVQPKHRSELKIQVFLETWDHLADS
jgi:hypothetical protein